MQDRENLASECGVCFFVCISGENAYLEIYFRLHRDLEPGNSWHILLLTTPGFEHGHYSKIVHWTTLGFEPGGLCKILHTVITISFFFCDCTFLHFFFDFGDLFVSSLVLVLMFVVVSVCCLFFCNSLLLVFCNWLHRDLNPGNNCYIFYFRQHRDLNAGVTKKHERLLTGH